MSSVEIVTDDGVYAPLLRNSSHELGHEEAAARGGEITSSIDEPEESNPDSAGQKRRLVSVDVFRGLTVAVRCFSIFYLHNCFQFMILK